MLREKFNKSLRFKFLSIMFGILFLGTLTISLVIAINEKRALKDSLTNMGQTFASYIAKLSKEPLILKNSVQLDAIVDDANRDENIVYAVIYDNKGVPLTTKYPSINYRLPAINNILLALSRDHELSNIIEAIKKKEAVVEISVPIMAGIKTIGTATIGMSEKKMYQHLVTTILYIAFINIIGAILLGAVLFVTSKKIIFDPIFELAHATFRIAKGDLSGEVEVKTTGEVKTLVDSFNEMIRNLKKVTVSRDYVDSIIKSMINTLIVVSPQGKIMSVNSAACRLLGFNEEELIGQPAETIFSGEKSSRDLWMKTMLADGHINNIEESYRTKDGREVAVLLSGSVMHDDNHLLRGIVYVAQDITERQRAEEALRESEKRFKDIADNAEEWIWEVDAQGKLTFSSPAGEKILGYTTEEILGKPFYEFFQPEYREETRQAAFDIIAAKKSFRGVLYQNLHKSGEPVWLAVSGAPILDGNGNLLGYRGSNRDMTASVQAEEALRASEKRFSDVAETSGSWIWEIDAQGKYTYSSPMVEKLLGYQPEEMLNTHFYDVFHPDDREELKQAALALFADKKPPVEFLHRDVRKNGEVVWLSTTGVPLLDEKGDLLGYRGVNIDVTVRHKAEEALKQANEKLQALVAEAEDRNRNITLLHDMSEALQSCQLFEEASKVIVHFAPKFFPHDSGALHVFRHSKNLLVPVAAWGMDQPQNGMFPPEECWAMRSGRVHAVADPGSGLVCAHIPDSYCGSYLCVPMAAQGEALGILHLRLSSADQSGSGGMPLEDLLKSRQRLAMTVAENIALALANLNLRETLRSQAIRDPLTGLFNRRYMEETLNRELHRIQRLGSSIGVIMMDLDHFKKFNDAYGHKAGDALLSAVGNLIQSQCREEDIPCRYGGEEFLLVLPGASLDVTAARAQQLREGIKQLQVYHRGQLLQPTSMSLGVALFPDHGSNGDVIIGAADTALYRAKQEGRDRVVVVHELRGNQNVSGEGESST